MVSLVMKYFKIHIFGSITYLRISRNFIIRIIIIRNELVALVRGIPQNVCPSISCTASSKLSEFPGDTSQVFKLHN